jgi:hypothetical protein
VESGEGVKRGGGWVGKSINYNMYMSRRRWGRWCLLSVLLRGGLVAVGVCGWDGRFLLTGLIKRLCLACWSVVLKLCLYVVTV